MAIFDNLFGTQPEYLSGLLGADEAEKLRKQAMTTGLVNSAIALIAQPRNQRFGSALPYIGRALMAGQQAGQGVYNTALQGLEMQQKIAELKRQQEARKAFDEASKNLYRVTSARTQTITQPGGYAPAQTEIQEGQVAPNFGMTRLPDVTQQITTAPETRELNPEALMNIALTGDTRVPGLFNALKTISEITKPAKGESPFAKVDPKDFTKESVAMFSRTGRYEDLVPIVKSGATEAIKNYEYAVSNGYGGSFEDWAKALTPYQMAQLGIDAEQLLLAQQEAGYKFGTPMPQQTTQMPRTATMQDVADTARATGKTTFQVINDMKKRGIKVQGAK